MGKLPRKELKFQGHIIDSYKIQGGLAKKWATQLTVGVPDLVCSMQDFHCHLMEVKHRPDWTVGKTYQNPLTAKQLSTARKYEGAGSLITLGLIAHSTEALGSSLYLFPATSEYIKLRHEEGSTYRRSTKYDIRGLLTFLLDKGRPLTPH